eukprot:Colp12_sorted_trinity150504_noHs@678
MEDARSFLRSKLIADHPIDRPMVIITSDQTASQALETLVDKHISSAPVFDTKSGKYIGLVDTFDLLAVVLEVCLGDPSKGSKSFKEVLESSDTWKSRPVKDIIDRSGNNTFMTVPSTGNLLEVVEILASGVHRVAVVDTKTGLVTRLITQSAMVQYLAENASRLGEKLNVPINVSGLKQVTTISIDAPAIDALALIREKKLSAVGVATPEGQLTGSISVNDVRIMLKGDAINIIFCNCMDFISQVRTMEGRQKSRSFPPVVVVNPKNTLGEIMRKFHATKIHRLYVVDEERQALGVISLKDVLRHLISP